MNQRTARRSALGSLLLASVACGVACAREATPAVPPADIAPAASVPPPPRPATPAMLDPFAPRLRNEDVATLTEDVDAAAPSGNPVSDADRVIASLRRKFKACYQAGLNQDPTIQGRVVIVAKIAPDGAVDSTTSEQTPLPKPVTNCLERAVRNAQFSPPGGTGSTLRIPITFKQADPDAGP